MMHMYNTTGTGTLMTGMTWLHIHWFFGALAIVGFILFTVWALRALSKDQLKALSIGLVATGAAGIILTATPAVPGFKVMMGMWRDDDVFCGHDVDWEIMDSMMERMEYHAEEDDHEDHDDMMEMMHRMMQ